MSVGSDAHLAAGSHADRWYRFFGSAISEGEAGQVVSVFGATRVSGPVTDDAVAIFAATTSTARSMAMRGGVRRSRNSVRTRKSAAMW